ncbi:hypothetical protein DMH88_16030 [Escherichia coli]|nr:hypothetical protein [Escherichia coli]
MDNKLKNKLEVNALESGNYGGDFYPLTGREAFYLWGLGTTTAAANLYLNPDPQFRLCCGQHRLSAINIQ